MRRDLKVFRITQGLTQEQMAKKIGISRANYNLIENGKSNGSFAFWVKLQHKFKLEDAKVWKLKTNII